MESGHRIKSAILVKSIEEARGLIEILTNLKLTNDSLDIFLESEFEKFISFIQTNPVDCFFLDLNFTGFSVIKLADRLRKSSKFKKTPIVFIADKKNTEHELNPILYSPLIIDAVIGWTQKSADIENALNTVFKKRFTKTIPEKFKVLVVDDNPEIIYLMSSYMNELQHSNFETCSSLEEARNLIKSNEYDLLLLDWNLNDGTCIDVIEFVRAQNNIRLNQALIMAVTARNDVDDIMTLLKYNVKDYIIKPFGFEEFEEKLIYALEKHIKN